MQGIARKKPRKTLRPSRFWASFWAIFGQILANFWQDFVRFLASFWLDLCRIMDEFLAATRYFLDIERIFGSHALFSEHLPVLPPTSSRNRYQMIQILMDFIV